MATGSLAAEPHAWSATHRRDVARAYRAARRHSRRVRQMRIAVPTLAAIGTVAFILFTFFNPLQVLNVLPRVSGKLVVSGTKVTMEAPKIAGFTRDNRAYDLTADSAAQDLTKPDVIELSGVRAKMELRDRGTVEVTAVAGTYEPKTEMLKLADYIRLRSTSGYEAHLTQAVVEMRKGHIISNKPVEVLMINGKINANGLEVVDNGALLRFTDGVDMDVVPPRADASSGAQAER